MSKKNDADERQPEGQNMAKEVERQPYAEAEIREKRRDPLTAERDLASPPSEDTEGRQGVSSKKGKSSTGQKMESTRHNFDTTPAARPVAGAFGKEPSEDDPTSEQEEK